MSYILDALRRADSERERGGVPSLHSKQVPAGLADGDDVPAQSLQRLWWVVGALSIAVVALLAWLLMGRGTAETAPPVAPPEMARTSPLPLSSPAQPMPSEPGVASSPAPVTLQQTLPAQPAPPPVAAASRRVEPPAAAAPTTTRVAVNSKPETSLPAPKQGTARSDQDAEAHVPTLAELPDEVRRQLPALNVGGASYSKNAASRMLILNGQVFREGDTVARELVLEQIRLKHAVLSYRGTRYSIAY